MNVDQVLDGARPAHAHAQLLAKPAPRAVCRRQVLACCKEDANNRVGATRKSKKGNAHGLLALRTEGCCAWHGIRRTAQPQRPNHPPARR